MKLDFFPAGTPAHPEYPSGHSTVSGAAAFVLTKKFGDSNGIYGYVLTCDPAYWSFPEFLFGSGC